MAQLQVTDNNNTTTTKNERNFVTDAINLKTYNLSEADKIIVMYSKDKGLIKGVAKGVKKPTSKLGARMDLLVANKVMFCKGKNLNRICQADSINSFQNSRKDIDKIFYSMYIAEIINSFGHEDDPDSSDIYNLLYTALNSITNAHSKIEVLIAVIKFQLKLMIKSGFSIELETCLCCQKNIKNETLYFVPEMGGVICHNCANKIHYNKKQMPYKLRDFLVAMSENDFDANTLYEEKANEQVCNVIFELLKSYIDIKSPIKIKSAQLLSEI